MRQYPLYPALAKMKDGDAILYRKSSLSLGKIIQRFVPKGMLPCNHASIVHRNDKDLQVPGIENVTYNHACYVDIAESAGGPLRLVNLCEQIKKYKGQVYWLPTEMTDRKRSYCRHHIQKLLGKRIDYDVSGLIWNAVRMVASDIEDLWCSEFVVYVWYLSGYIGVRDLQRNRPWDLPDVVGKEPMELVWKEKDMAKYCALIRADTRQGT